MTENSAVSPISLRRLFRGIFEETTFSVAKTHSARAVLSQIFREKISPNPEEWVRNDPDTEALRSEILENLNGKASQLYMFADDLFPDGEIPPIVYSAILLDHCESPENVPGCYDAKKLHRQVRQYRKNLGEGIRDADPKVRAVFYASFLQDLMDDFGAYQDSTSEVSLPPLFHNLVHSYREVFSHIGPPACQLEDEIGLYMRDIEELFTQYVVNKPGPEARH